MTNMSYMILTALVMLLQITNLSVSNDIISTGCIVLWSNTIPKWNVWLLVRIQSHLFPFQQDWWTDGDFGQCSPHSHHRVFRWCFQLFLSIAVTFLLYVFYCGIVNLIWMMTLKCFKVTLCSLWSLLSFLFWNLNVTSLHLVATLSTMFTIQYSMAPSGKFTFQISWPQPHFQKKTLISAPCDISIAPKHILSSFHC